MGPPLSVHWNTAQWVELIDPAKFNFQVSKLRLSLQGGEILMSRRRHIDDLRTTAA
jgi:hypothetical protein